MNDKNRVHLSKHQTILNQTLQEQLVSLEFNARDLHAHMNTRVADYASALRAYDSLPDVADYASALGAYDSLPDVADYASALRAYDSLPDVADYASALGAYDSLPDVADYASALRAYDSLPDATDYASALRAYDSLPDVADYASALRAYDSLPDVADYASALSVYDGLPDVADYVSALSVYDFLPDATDYASALSVYDGLPDATDYASALSVYDSLPDVADYASELRAHDFLPDVADYASELRAHDFLPDVADYASALSVYDGLPDATDYASALSVYDSLPDVADYASDWQKRVNSLSKTQASLGFPNIIRGELAGDPFRISTPTQRRTPLLDLPPTASTGEVYEEISPEIIPMPSPELVPITNHKPVFIVHGHDHPARDAVAEFVNNWGLTATILDKEPNKGRTIIEKFEDLADEASFAIVLFTPDDVGASVKDKANLKPRARQNVILELGYFLKAVGRQQICILHKGNLELPSDIQGVVYVHMDDNGEWKQAIVREMESIGLLVDGNEI